MLTRLAFSYLLNIFDFASTLVLVKLYGAGVKVNRLMGLFISNTWAVAFVKVVVVGLLLWLIGALRHKAYKLCNICSWVAVIVYSCLAIYHIVIFVSLLVI